ncbi:alcohol oxidase, partial [Aureobasidium melanogenum]
MSDTQYDYIVCGGGTSGCVVAAQLAEDPSLRVLLVEAGAHNEHLENVHMVGGWSKNFDTPQDWNIVTEPTPGIDNRQVKVSRGRFLGGSSGVNGTLCIRGTQQDYDDWDLEGWSGKEMFEAMRKSETFHDKDWFEATEGAHGTDGPLHIEPHDLAPISERLLESFQSHGMPLHPDMFTTGETAQGCGHAPRTVYQGLRTTGADFVTKDQQKPNIEILVNTVVDKIRFEDMNGRMTARSVDLAGPDGTRKTVQAKSEIIISGGAYCTPPILLRSGIGPRDDLEKMGIECLVDAPGVGQNLLDHLIVFVFYETEQAGLTTDHHVYHGDSLATTYAQWQKERTGFLSTFPFGSFAFARLDERLKDESAWQEAMKSAKPGRDAMGLTKSQPNVEYFTTECYGGPKQYADFPTDNKHAFAMITELFSPRSRGTVVLKSKDPLDNPIVDHNYLSDPLDLLVLTEGVPNLTHHAFTKREEWIPHVKQHATTCYHAAGTAKMGKASDNMAVLDEKLQVRGVKGLRVADCSVMPTLHGGHTQMPAYGIGEQCAKFIRQTSRVTLNELERIDSVMQVEQDPSKLSGADINHIGGIYGTALQVALEAGFESTVLLLLSRGADPNLVAGGHGTALQVAAYRGFARIVEILLEHGADVGIEVEGGARRNAIQAAMEGHDGPNLDLAQFLRSQSKSKDGENSAP